jgi:hypothetical protein
MICKQGRPLANWINCSQLGPSPRLSTLGCSSTHNNTLQVTIVSNWAPHILFVKPIKTVINNNSIKINMICDMKKMIGGETKQNPRDSTYTSMLINYLISINKS